MLGMIFCAVILIVGIMGVRILQMKARILYLTKQEAYWRHVAAHKTTIEGSAKPWAEQ